MEPSSLLFGIVTGAVGLAAVQYGRRTADARRIGLGVGLLFLPFLLDAGPVGWTTSAVMTVLLFWP